MRRVLINGAAGVVAFLHGQPFSIAAVTIKNGKIVEIVFLADPDRIAQLDLTELGDQRIHVHRYRPRAGAVPRPETERDNGRQSAAQVVDRLSISLASERLSRSLPLGRHRRPRSAIRSFGRTPPADACDAIQTRPL